MSEPLSSLAHTPFTLRPFQNADAETVAQLVTDSVRGHWVYSAEQFPEDVQPDRVRWVAEQGGGVVATVRLAPFGSGVPDALRLDLAGEGAAFTPLYLTLLGRLPAGFTRLLGVTREDWPEKMGFFASAGFRNAWQSWGAHLDLAGFEFAPYQPLEERLFLDGYEVERLEKDASDSDWAALHTLYVQGSADAPRNPTTTPDALSAAALREMVEREEVAFVVRWRGQLVASTRLTPHGAEVETEHTVTNAAHRSRGLATLVKARALAWAKAEGFIAAGTGGTVLNLPMLRVNSRLGYVPEAMWVTWEQGLEQGV
ncbi:GNAT family N-acetyltransferase [Deinococcus sp. Arct2-2]|uniref:GNAT family N-acetyltransferase n=1 Tax=Deinococcus sp. Arct2-2 TaxID=2568653 RepID=UPI0010A4B32A|nr:GNAT family N-acetyltransferase [Deinococcus sp. Arct2-2]THF70671.1 GNAT family N-acetyltransferase [Deinococcus sp. Arct2-2]